MQLSNQRGLSYVLSNSKLVLYFGIFGNHSPYLNPIAYGPTALDSYVLVARSHLGLYAARDCEKKPC